MTCSYCHLAGADVEIELENAEALGIHLRSYWAHRSCYEKASAWQRAEEAS